MHLSVPYMYVSRTSSRSRNLVEVAKNMKTKGFIFLLAYLYWDKKTWSLTPGPATGHLLNSMFNRPDLVSIEQKTTPVWFPGNLDLLMGNAAVSLLGLVQIQIEDIKTYYF